MGSSNKEASLVALSRQGGQPVRSGSLGAIGSTWALNQWDRSPWRILSREWGRLTYKGLGEECRWKMGYRSKYGDESIAKAAAWTLGRDGGSVDQALAVEKVRFWISSK